VYVVAISVLEYRNGILLSENKKDLQLHVLQCLPQNQPPAIQHVFEPTDSVSGDTLILQVNDTTCYQVVVTDPDFSPLNAQAISAFFTGPNAPSVHVSGTNPLLIDICWIPTCDFVGQDFELVIMGYDEDNCPIYNPAFDTVFIKVLPPLNASPIVGHDLPPNNPFGPDTLLLEVDSNACASLYIVDPSANSGPFSYSFQVNDLSGGGSLNMGSTVVSANPDSLLLELCFQGQCENMDHLYQVILEGRLEGLCPPYDKAWDTMYVYVPQLPNPPPLVNPDLAGLSLDNDTILVDVHDTLCFLVTVDDSFPAVSFGLDVVLEAMDGQNAGGFQPSMQVLVNSDSLLAQICWYPVCENVERLFRIILIGEQGNRCEQSASAQDTVYVRVRNVINPPPIIGHSFDSLNYAFNGDTIIIAADSAACFNFSLSDQGGNTYLELSHEVQFLNGQASGQSTSIQYSTQSDTLLEGEICFVPGCEFLGQTLMVALSGRDTFDCNNANRVFDTVFIRVIEPSNQPPLVSHDLSGLDVSGGIVNVVPNGQPYCYTVTITDPDILYADLTASGVGNIFEDWYRYGNPASITTTGSNPMTATICWNPSCYDSGETFGIVVCARDTSRCALTESICDTVMFTVGGCNIQIGNVFSPNGDGINDDFAPFNTIGVEFYRLHIFDRWGRPIYTGENQSWNGGMGNDASRQLPEGVYYFTVEYQLFSARGVPLKQQEVGHVTLMR
jgi:gliding motility-associated-like protein